VDLDEKSAFLVSHNLSKGPIKMENIESFFAEILVRWGPISTIVTVRSWRKIT
jgi:hypothetical protein